MACNVCHAPLHDCTCEDLNERMRHLTGAQGNIYSRWCRRCDSHYCRCDCEEPDWWIRSGGELVRAISDEKVVVHVPPGGPIEA